VVNLEKWMSYWYTSFDVARRIKEMYCYTSSDIVKVFNYIKCLVMLLGEHIYFDSEEYLF